MKQGDGAALLKQAAVLAENTVADNVDAFGATEFDYQVIRAGVDCATYDEGRSIISPMPGVWVSLHADGVNALTPALRNPALKAEKVA